MEQWKLPELRQSVGYQLHVPDRAFDHVHTHTSAPNSSGQSGANRNADASSLTSLDKTKTLNNSVRLWRIRCNHQIIKSRLQARLDDQESKNRVLAACRDRLKQREQLLASLKAMKDKIVAAEFQERQLEKEIKSLDSAVWGYDMVGLLDELKEGEEKRNEDGSEEDKDEEEEDEDQSEEEEVHAMDNLEEESVVEEDSESNCSDEEDDY